MNMCICSPLDSFELGFALGMLFCAAFVALVVHIARQVRKED